MSPQAPHPQSSATTERDDTGDRSAWRRPIGVSPGTWRYAHLGSIASRYDHFVAATPLCGLDLAVLSETFPARSESHEEVIGPSGFADATQTAQQESLEKNWILDLGCGTGRAAETLSTNGHQVLAVDLSIPMLREVAARALPRVMLLHANLVELECLADDSASGGVCLFSTLGMIQGRSNRRRFLSHVRRLVCPGGCFLLHVHNRYAALTHRAGRRSLARTAIASITRANWEFGDAVYAYRGLTDMFLHQFSGRELRADLKATRWNVRRWSRVSLDGSALLRDRRGIAGGFLVVVD